MKTLLLPSLAVRCREPELMDQPDLDNTAHRHALTGLARVNQFSRSSAILWPAILQLGRQSQGRPVRVLDVACGGGDLLLDLKSRAERSGVPLELAGCDVSPVALRVGVERAEQKGLSVKFFEADVIASPLPDDYDVVMCSTFLHHLDDQEAAGLLANMGKAARRMVLVNDLTRSQLGYLLALIGTRLLTRSYVVHFDGPQSVRSAFSIDEVAAMAKTAGLNGAQFSRHWPQRFLLKWKR